MSRISTAVAFTKPMTLDEWGALDEDVEGELIDGFLEEEMATFLHVIVAMWLARILGTWVRRRHGYVARSEAKIAVGPRRGRKRDLVGARKVRIAAVLFVTKSYHGLHGLAD